MPDGKDRKDYLLKECEIIQDAISRMSHDSFLIKGWTITLVVATLLFRGTKYQTLIAFVPLIGFWFLDAYYLYHERLFRKLYNWVRVNRLGTDENLFSMNTERFKGKGGIRFTRTIFASTLLCFYGSITGLMIIVSYLTFTA